MDHFRYFDISLRAHVLCNPTSLDKLDTVIGLLDVPGGGRVLDIACGKGEFLTRVVERYGCSATGVDASPYALEEARASMAARVPQASYELLQMDGADYMADEESFDVTACIGASRVFGGHRSTLQALTGWTKAGGYIVAGEVSWRTEPAPDYLEATGLARESFASLSDNVAAGEALGLTPVYMSMSSRDDWDHYETLQWHAVDRWARSHPGDPDREEILHRARADRDTYLRWGRETLDWGLYVFRK